MILDLEGFTKLHKAFTKSRLWQSLPRSGLNFYKQRLKYGRYIFFSLQNFKYLKIKNKYIGHLPKLVFGHIYMITRPPIEKQHYFKNKMR